MASARTNARRLAVPLVALVVVIALLVAWRASSGSGQHRLRAVFAAALQILPGQRVEIGGRSVGSIHSVALSNGEALVTMNIDGSDWPLHSGTTAVIRFGSVASYASRYIQLQPGRAGAPQLADNALLPVSDTTTPVEVDQLYSGFNRATRAHFRTTIGEAAQTLNGTAPLLSRDVTQGAPGLEQTDGFLADLGAGPGALKTMITAGARTFATLHASNSELQGLVSNAASTFGVLSDNARALALTIGKLAPAMRASEPTLAHLDRSTIGLQRLTTAIGPGAIQLRATAAPLARALGRIEQIAPDARNALTTGSAQLPAVTTFLRTTRTVVPHVGTALRTLQPMFACLRPYTPEFTGWLETWQGGPYDNVGPYATIAAIQTPVSPGTSDDSAQAVANSNGTLHYAFPRPPGLSAGQVWLQPQCGAGADALNPADDPEAGGK